MSPLKLDPGSPEAVEEPQTGPEPPGPSSSTELASGSGSTSERADPGEPPGPSSSTEVTSGVGPTSERVDVLPPKGSCAEPETPSPVLRKGEEPVGPEEEPESGKSNRTCR